LRAKALLGTALAEDAPWWSQVIRLPHWELLLMPGQPTALNPNPPPATRTVQSEITELVTLMDYRAAVLDEALAQRDNVIQYHSGMLMFSRSTHPSTYLLAALAIEAGTFFAMYFKNCRYKLLDANGNPVLDANGNPIFSGPRPRPSQICPWLMPPIAVPGHASYPSGHATQSALLSLLLSQVMPAEVGQPTIYDTITSRPSLLEKLAERVARNREVLGLHYPTDSQAGRLLAGQVYALLAPATPIAAGGLTPQAVAAANTATLLTTAAVATPTTAVTTDLNNVATAVPSPPVAAQPVLPLPLGPGTTVDRLIQAAKKEW
jgi:membrane-associated phospholipid phosphatase